MVIYTYCVSGEVHAAGRPICSVVSVMTHCGSKAMPDGAIMMHCGSMVTRFARRFVNRISFGRVREMRAGQPQAPQRTVGGQGSSGSGYVVQSKRGFGWIQRPRAFAAFANRRNNHLALPVRGFRTLQEVFRGAMSDAPHQTTSGGLIGSYDKRFGGKFAWMETPRTPPFP